jgi:hypothetical protein
LHTLYGLLIGTLAAIERIKIINIFNISSINAKLAELKTSMDEIDQSNFYFKDNGNQIIHIKDYQ